MTWQEAERRAIAAAQDQLNKLAAEGTTPAGPSFLTPRDNAAGAMVSQMANAVPQVFSPISSTLNYSGGPILFRLGRKLLRTIVGRAANQTREPVPLLTNVDHTRRPSLETYTSSLLSNVTFLRTLTRFPRFNHLLIDMLEGQLITLFVVVVFILAFLIREWVVQQQPGLNLAAAADAQNQGDGNVPALQQLARQHAEQHLPQAQERLPGTPQDIDEAQPADARPQRIPTRSGHRRAQRPLAQVSHAENDDAGDTEDQASFDGEPDAAAVGTQEKSPDSSLTADETTLAPQQRPSMPTRNALRQAAEIRRVLEEQSRASGQQDWPGLKIFMDLWARAEREPGEVLKIIDQEGKNQELGWIVAFMKRLEKIPETEKVQSVEADASSTGNVANDLANDGIREIGNLVLPFGSEEMQKATGLLPETLAHDFWPSTNAKSKNSEEENSLGLQRGPSLDTEDQEQDISPESHSGLRDIGNQQLDRESTKTGSNNIQSEGLGSDSRSDFVVVPSDPENASTPNFSSASTPEQQRPENPFHPDYVEEVADPEASELPIESLPDATSDILNHLEEQTQNMTRLAEERRAILQDAPSQSQAAEVGNSQISYNATPATTSTAHRGYTSIVMDWLWGEGLPPADPSQTQDRDDERIVANIEEEAPFVAVAHGQPVIEDANDQDAAEPVQDAEVRAAAVQAGLDPNEVEAVDDAEDLEGIMELVGMQGPIVGLIQNGMFCAVIVSLTIFFGIWIPYIAGKFFLVFLANPISLLFKMPLRWASSFADFTIDFLVFSAGCAFYWTDVAARFVCSPMGYLVPEFGRISQNRFLAETAKDYAENALDRLLKGFMLSSGSFLESDIPTFSVIAHESLRDIQRRSTSAARIVLNNVVNIASATSITGFGRNILTVGIEIHNNIVKITGSAMPKLSGLKAVTLSLASINPLRIDLSTGPRTAPLDFTLSEWNSKDRAIAILLGYLAFGFLGVAYLKVSSSLKGKNAAGKVDGTVADVLYQAGGVLKVVLIISIEMIVFPLFCGLLLDVALLPLFGNANLLSRIQYSVASPWTSLFIHWFIGTCYMFHLALFVSMCRKIMRTGVLYFIRDPDDPTFHPVRDVLERSVITQFRKIIFSALVYGALVMICLGGVVWGVYYTFDGVFPIHWSSSEPVLEFPVDLLFYNLLMPVAVKLFRPSNALNQTYNWWLKKCARALRLSHFLFNDKREDEEGRHVHRTWKAFIHREYADPSNPVVGEDRRLLAEDRNSETYFLRDGRYVRTPASDQVRMPRGARTFLDVDEENNRIDGLEDPDSGPHGRANEQFTKVYVPPFFRLRISAFIFLIWLFAATTGVGVTVVPLIIGRFLFRQITPEHLQMNDVYAFSIGIYLVAGIGYGILHARCFFTKVHDAVTPTPGSTTATYLRYAKIYLSLTLRLLYTYGTFFFVLPALFALLLECYVIIPLHTYFGPPQERHTIHFVQDWTLGVLCVKTLGRLVLWYTTSRPAAALRNIVRDGWLYPDARLATRACFLPAMVLMVIALTLPFSLAFLAKAILFQDSEGAVKVTIYRYSYPTILGLGISFVLLGLLRKVFEGWRARIRDEVYLIGERLHNFGEKRIIEKRVYTARNRVEVTG